jgi:hypothetical protein
MPKMKTKRLRLAPDHRWRAQPGQKVLVLDRGAVWLEYPATWVVAFDGDSVKVRDAKPPDDNIVLGVSYHRWPAIGQGLSVASLVPTALGAGNSPYTHVGPVVEETRMDLTLAWVAARSIDPKESREACTRLCLARRGEIQALLTCAFWLADEATFDPCWHNFLATLQLAEWVEDPTKGPAVA